MGKKTHFEQIPLEQVKKDATEIFKRDEIRGQDTITPLNEISNARPNSGKRQGSPNTNSERSL